MAEIQAKGQLATRTLAMPADTNPQGDIFGGWLLSQMDIAGALVTSKKICSSRVVTVAVDGMKFHQRVFVGDVVCCYGEIIRIGRTSVTVNVEAFVVRQFDENRLKVTEGMFTYVNVDKDHKPSAIDEKFKN